MNRINLYCWLVALAIIIFGGFYLKYLNNALQAEKAALVEEKIKNKELNESLEKEKQNAIQNGRRIKELRDEIEKDKNSADWSIIYVPDVVSSVLRKHYRESQN